MESPNSLPVFALSLLLTFQAPLSPNNHFPFFSLVGSTVFCYLQTFSYKYNICVWQLLPNIAALRLTRLRYRVRQKEALNSKMPKLGHLTLSGDCVLETRSSTFDPPPLKPHDSCLEDQFTMILDNKPQLNLPNCTALAPFPTITRVTTIYSNTIISQMWKQRPRQT